MSTETQKPLSVPYDWLKSVPKELLAHDDIPLFGSAPPFPWERLNEYLQAKFHIKNFSVSRSSISQKTGEAILMGIGAPHKTLTITISPLNQELYFVMSEQEILKLMSALLSTEEPSLELSSEFTDPFFLFVGMEAIHAMGKVEFDKKLTFSLDSKNMEFPSETVHSFDLSLQLHETSVFGRVIIPSPFRHAWKSHYVPKTLKLPLPQKLGQKIEIPIHLEVGHVSMLLDQWKQVKRGDFILLDACSLESPGAKGKLLLTVNGNLLFRGKLKDGNIKILENPLYHEDWTPMPNKRFEDDEDNIEFTDEASEFSHEESEFTEMEETPGLEHDDDELMISEAELSSLEGTEQEEGQEQHSSEIEEHATHPGAASSPQQKARLLASSKPVAPQDIPLDIIVEVGRIKMSIQKVMELQPGNLLELDIHPESGVDLVVNGQKIAKGELLSLGDHLGVRIIDID